MSGRVLVMIGSVLLAGGVLGAAAWLGAAPPADGGGPALGDAAPNPAVAPTGLVGLNINPDDLKAGGQRMEPAFMGEFEAYGDDGKTITRLYGTEAVPREEFVADVLGPGAEIHFAPERVLTITAAQGTIYYPGNQPQRGDFHRDTVVTLYEAPPGETADLLSNRHVQMRLFLDDPTHFDREQGQVRTDGPVRLVGRKIDFTGRGMSLTFNAGQQRIEQLVLDHGHQLRMAADGPLTPDSPEPATAETATTAATPAQSGPGHAPSASSSAPPERPEDAQASGQTYLITLDGGVDVAVGDDGTALRGQTLRGTFVESSDSDNDDPAAPAAPPAPAPADIQATITADTPQPTAPQTVVATPAAQAPAPLNPNDPRALRHPQPNDIVVAWGGRLVLTPDPFTEATGDVGGTRVVLAGDATHPAQVITGEDQRLEAARVGYDADTDRVWAHAENPDSLDGPGITLIAPDVGRLTARSLELDRDAGLGVVTGPGQLDTQDQRLTVAFDQQLKLDFATDTDAPANAPATATATDSLSGFSGIQQATFVGQVKAHARDGQGARALTLQAHRLAIPFTRDAPDTDPRPAALIATADPDAPQSSVTAALPKTESQPNTDFRANTLTVDLILAETPEPPTQTASAPEPASASESEAKPEVDTKSDLGGLAVARLRARGDVSVQLDNGETQVTAHAMDGDPIQKRLELFGQDGVPAMLERGGARFVGPHLILHQDQETAEALGPGHFSANTDPNDPSAQVRVAWTRGMTIDNRAGHALFTGGVVFESDAAESRTKLNTHTLSIDFVPQDLDAQLAPQEDQAAEGTDGAATATLPKTKPQTKPKTANTLDIRRVHALADPQDSESLVNFTTETLEARGANAAAGAHPADAPPLTAFTLISRELDFVNVVPNRENRNAVDDHLTLQTVTVPGRGRMLISDYRTPAPTEEQAVAFAGAGLTAFAWEGRLTLDALQNDLRMEGDVLMVHEPLVAEDGAAETPVKLEAQVLTADLTETGGLGALAGGPAPAAQLRRVVGAGAIRISHDQSRVLADHLDYTAARGNVILTAEPGKLCELRQVNQPGGATTARRLVWDLDNDTFSIDGVRGGVVPIE